MAVAQPGLADSAACLFAKARRRLDARQVEEALALFTAAEQAGFSADECGGGRWFCRMLSGEFEHAWKESDEIARRGAHDPHSLWTGACLDRKRVVIRCLHGLGDAIQLIRFAPLLKKRVARLLVETPACLVRLFQTVPEVDEVFTWECPVRPLPEWDEQMEVMQLPYYFRVTPETIPHHVPYLFPPNRSAHDGRSKFSVKKAGIAWQASAWKPSRSIPLPDLLPVLAQPGYRFYSLQQSDSDARTPGIPAELVPESIVSTDDDVLSTACLIQQLDIVVTVDTMVAHLAGALGKPVCLLLEEYADWRWMLGKTDSPWYPTMRIFRQAKEGTWLPAVEHVAAVLKQFSI